MRAPSVSPETFAVGCYIWGVLANTPWGRFRSLVFLDMGLSSKSIAVLNLVSLPLKSVAYVVWGSLGDHMGLRAALLLTIALGAASLQPFAFPALYSSFSAVLAAKVLRSVANGGWPLIDSLALKVARERYGRVRLWGSVSWGLSALLVGFLLDALFRAYGVASVIALSSAMLAVFAGAVYTLFPRAMQLEREAASARPSWRHYLSPLRSHRVLPFLVMAFLFGVSVGACSVVPVWMKRSFGGGARHVGINTFASVSLGIPVFVYHPDLMARFGGRTLLLTAVAGHAIRLILYRAVNVDNFWFLLPTISLMHLFSFALFWTTATRVLHDLTPASLVATSQTMLASSHSLLGQGMGSFCALWLLENYGAQFVFLGALLAAVGVAIGVCLLDLQNATEPKILSV